MIALVDMGNTRFKYTFVAREEENNNKATCIKDIKSESNSCWNEVSFKQLFSNVNQILFASVAQNINEKLICDWCNKHEITITLISSKPECRGVKNGYIDYSQLGIDRWLAIIGAHQLLPQRNILIVDSGTATTIDLLDMKGVHHGGWILPGINLMSSSVLLKTSQVKGHISPIDELTFGRDSSSNLSNASWAATLGLIEQAILKAEEKLKLPVQILITGGNGEALEKLLLTTRRTKNIILRKDLVFIGLACHIDD